MINSKYLIQRTGFVVFSLCLLFCNTSYGQDTFHIAKKIIHFKKPDSYVNIMKENSKFSEFAKKLSYEKNFQVAFYVKNKSSIDDSNSGDVENFIKIYVPIQLVGIDLENKSISGIYAKTKNKLLNDNLDPLIKDKVKNEVQNRLLKQGISGSLEIGKTLLLADSLINPKAFYIISATTGSLNFAGSDSMKSLIQSTIMKNVNGQLVCAVYTQVFNDVVRDIEQVKKTSIRILNSLY